MARERDELNERVRNKQRAADAYPDAAVRDLLDHLAYLLAAELADQAQRGANQSAAGAAAIGRRSHR